jgi:hypothetical protein
MKIETIAETIKELTDVNILEQSRRRSVVEMRSVANRYLIDVLGLRWTDIVREYAKNGFNTTHASIIHSVNTYKQHSFYNSDLDLIYETLLNSSKMNIIKRVNKMTVEQIEKVEAILQD